MAPWSFSHGASTDIGGRKENQDEHVFVEAVFPGSSWSLYGVFDGHGDLGQKVARFVKKELPLEISAKSNPASLVADPAKVLTDAFAAVNERLRENEDIDTYMSGTTAAVLLACRETGTLIVGHVGDCKVVVGVAGPSEAPKTLTSEHTCEVAAERQRIESKGGRIGRMQVNGSEIGPLRIYKGSMPYPGLVVSRSFGDDVAKRLGVVPEPEVVVHKLPSKSKYVIVLGTDGVWDGITPDEAVLIASGQPTAEKASNELTKKSKEALDRICIDDNTTNVIVFADPA